MNILTKTLLCVTGVAGVFVATYFANSLVHDNSLPLTLKEQQDWKTEYSDFKLVGNRYGAYLSDVYGLKDKENQNWWNRAFRKYQVDLKAQKELSTQFEKDKVEFAFANKETKNEDANKSLNKVCEAIYKLNLEDLNKAENNILHSNLWSYCSPLGEFPKTIEESNETNKYTVENSLGKDKAKELISTNNPKNDLFWEINNKDFHKQEVEPGFFETAKNKNQTIKDACEEAYQIAIVEKDPSKPKQIEVTRYCSLVREV